MSVFEQSIEWKVDSLPAGLKWGLICIIRTTTTSAIPRACSLSQLCLAFTALLFGMRLKF